MVRSVKGNEINMMELSQKNSSTIALGNASMNARGDLLSKGGVVVKTREELAREYHTKGTDIAKDVPLSDEINKMLETPVYEDTSADSKAKKKKVEPKVDLDSAE